MQNTSQFRDFEISKFRNWNTTVSLMDYVIPPQTHIGHGHLKVSDIERALTFYRDLLGFEITQWYGTSAVFLSAGGYHHHIGLNTWYSKNAPPAPVKAAGLFHVAILYPTRRDLAVILKRLIDAQYPLTGAADHGVSEALYMNDPDQNGIELYWDRPRDQWPRDEKGELQMVTEELDLNGLLAEI
jgi:catechol 2,3-dioxygenase